MPTTTPLISRAIDRREPHLAPQPRPARRLTTWWIIVAMLAILTILHIVLPHASTSGGSTATPVWLTGL